MGDLDFFFLAEYWPALLWGAWWTVVMTTTSLVPGAALGVLCALARAYGGVWIARAAAVYVEVIRNTPSLIQAFWLFFGLAFIRKGESELLAWINAWVAKNIEIGKLNGIFVNWFGQPLLADMTHFE